eukprot:CAMPEP_0115655878 /NCGR_PEP_ID=MMETSP0272-20121206/43868_1 /TAXON_ID=71861 /ORGANISM="Scrippsiella trochoidea, Strain CCMP3099" /LENGTH=371 /DNA_ID=CAMNT_0003093841 /DNA_START=30 /DNA_END=1142 /DNA_ORIENTATION=-
MALATTESAFLTSLNAERKKAQNRQQKRQELLENMEGGDQILKLHNDLQSLADDLDERVEGKLKANEKTFFLAYKNFMYTVQKEFKELKQKADEEETKTRRDAKIQSLEKELDWFMHEALRLDELCKKHKKDLDKWKSKAEALEDDRQFLENSIKTAKRNNKTLRGAVEKAQTSAYSALVAGDDTRHAPSTTSLALQAEAPAAVTDQTAPLALEDTPIPSSGLSKELEDRYQTCVKRLKQQLETEQRLAAKLRAVSDRQFGEPSELEAFFVDCVEHVKGDIAERRRQTATANSQGKSSRSRQQDAATPTLAPVTLDDFTVSDRRKVVEHLLSSEQVLQFLYDKLFPPAAPMRQATTSDPTSKRICVVRLVV